MSASYHDRRCKAKILVAVLVDVTSLYLTPSYVRSDNGPEFTAYAHTRWCKRSSTITAYIELGATKQKCFVGSFNDWCRGGLLNIQLFTTWSDAQVLATSYGMMQN